MDYHALAEDAIRNHGSQQKIAELAWLGALLKRKRVKNMVEVGTYAGGTAWFFAQLGINVLSVDIHLGHVLGGNDHERISRVMNNSLVQAQATEDHSLDFVFIDGDHRLQAVTADWEAWRSKTRLLAFHDIVEHAPATQCDVSWLWNDISGKYKTEEFRDTDGSMWAGIGVVIL